MRINIKYFGKILTLYSKIIIFVILFISFSTELFPNTNSVTIPAGSYFKPKIGLALSGGGARGIAQIGVLKSFEKNNINIDYISGTSIGAIVGGLYASGYTGDELEKLLSTNDWSKTVALSNNKRSDLFLDQKEIYDMSLITVKFDNFNIRVPEAVSGGSPFDDFIQRIFWSAPYQPESNFDSLKIPFRAVATDLVSASSISFAAGNITKIVRASATIPLRYTPIRIDSMVLVDGGVLSNVPVPALNEFKPDLIIAVNSTSPLLEMKDLNNAWNLADQVVSIAMDKFTQSSMSNSDLVITPNIGNHSNNDFSNLDSLIILGEQSSDLQVSNLKQLIRQKQDEIIKNYIDSIINQLDFDAIKINFENYPSQKAEFVKKRFGQTLEKSELEAFLRFLIENNNDNEVITLVQEYDNLLIYNQESKKINSIKITSDIDDKSFIKNLEYSVNFKYKSEYYNKFVNSRIINSIYQELKNQNYQFCKVSVKNFIENELNIEVKSGKINKINIKGSNVRKFMVLRDLVFEENDLLTVNSLIDSWENLQNTDLFVDVEILPYRDKDNNLNIDINLRDGGDQTLRIGGRVDSERNAQGGLYLIQENLFNLGTRLLMHLTGSETYFTSSVRFDNPRIFNTEYSVLIDAYYKQKQNYEYTPIKGLSTNRYENIRVLNYRVERYGIIGSLGIQIEKDGRLFSDFRFEKQRYNKDSDTIKSDFYDISTIKLGTIFDNLNDKYFPTNGRSIELFLETNFLQSSNIRAFSKAELNYLSVFSIGKHTISQSLQFGAADETLPYPEFFSMGGEDKFLGMLEDEMIGRQIVLGTLAYRVLMPFELFFDTYFLFNYNIGSAWEKTENIRIGDLKHGLGLGLAFNTPLGPAKVMTGKGFYFRNAPQGVVWGPTNFYFSLGMKLN